jgi:putative tricarboxylic transport membrane protein
MSEGPPGSAQVPGPGRAAFRRKGAELGVAAFFFLIGAIVIYDSVRLGFGWQEIHGPRPGYFPFIIGVIMCVASLVNLVQAMRVKDDKPFVEVGQLKLVLAVLVPTALFALAVTWIGIYVSAVLFIGFFMRWLGKYPWWKVVAVGFGTSAVLYLVFEKWFKVPLPKGPLENLLGLS